MELIIGIESSCDETGISIVQNGVNILSSSLYSQTKTHTIFNGIVPEIASREHISKIAPLFMDALLNAKISPDKLTGVAATSTPGLIGALLVGLNFGKGLAFSLGVPFYSVNHIYAHMYGCFLSNPDIDYFPCVSLVVSGGHTLLFLSKSHLEHELLGGTIDDAAGEAFDKVAAILNLGYPGGPIIEKLAKNGNPSVINFPRAMSGNSNLNFSFSGLKTAVLYHTKGFNNKKDSPLICSESIEDICASFQASVIDTLTEKVLIAAKKYNVKYISASGGVIANSTLRNKLVDSSAKAGIKCILPKLNLSTDNADIVAGIAYHMAKAGLYSSLDADAIPTGVYKITNK